MCFNTFKAVLFSQPSIAKLAYSTQSEKPAITFCGLVYPSLSSSAIIVDTRAAGLVRKDGQSKAKFI